MSKSFNPPVRVAKGSYIQGKFERVEDPNGEIFSRDPGNLELETVRVPFCYEHVHAAVAAARTGFTAWRMKKLPERAALLKKYAADLGRHRDSLSQMITLETGRPLWDTAREVARTVDAILTLIQVAETTPMEQLVENAGRGSSGTVRFFPRGVAAVVSPLSEPLFQPHTQIIPALLYGNTVVLKASKSAPFVGQRLAEILSESDLPSGTWQILQGDSEVARRLCTHPGVDTIFFSGSPETGLKLQKQLAGESWKKLVLEMGGKNSVVVWNDANYEEALYESFLSCFASSGQLHASASRVLVHQDLFDRFLKDFHSLSKRMRVGYGFGEKNEQPFMGPLFNEESLESYVRFQGIAVREGCEEIMRGKALERSRKGFYVAPSIHVVPEIDHKSVYQKTEAYSPNAAFYRISDLDEVSNILALPGHSLVHSVYTHSREVYLRLLENARVGLLNWNHPTLEASYRLPRVGLQRSGNNHPMGSFAVHQCTYPLSSLEQKTPFSLSDLPEPLPRLETKG